MTWTKFTILLLGSYGFYFGFNILMDYLRQPKVKATGSPQSLQLVEDVHPVVVDDADFAQATTVESELPPRQHNSATTVQKPEAVSEEAAMEDSTHRQQTESGGVSLSELLRLYRQKAILQSAQYDFTT